MPRIAHLFVIFIICSFLGWLIESLLSYFENKKIINRGFLIGPYCPIYGLGVIVLIVLLKKYYDDLVVLFIMSVVICSILEYLTSFILEKIFSARWWDYSHIPFNINGRICLRYSILFGIGGLVIIKIYPIFEKILISIPNIILYPFCIIIAIIFIVDVIISFNIINKLKLSTLEINKDNTEEIVEKISIILQQKTNKFRRIIKAFPDARIIIRKRNNQ